MASGPTWKAAVREIISSLPREFALADVLRHRETLEKAFPNNRFVDAKIRQSLQILRDQGVLAFVERGRYVRLDVPPVFSPLIDMELAAQFLSGAQIARVVLETWASFNLYCLNCQCDALDKLKDNTPVADFACIECDTRYQLKTKNGRFGSRISGAALQPVLGAIRSGSMPEHVLVEYDARFGTVVFVDAIPGRLITEERVIARAPLRPTARRAGWQGCNIDVAGLPSVRMVAPVGVARSDVRQRWSELA